MVVDGCSIAFVVWAYEAIPSFALSCATLRSALEHQRPRVLRWTFKSNVRGDFTHFFDAESRQLRFFRGEAAILQCVVAICFARRWTIHYSTKAPFFEGFVDSW